MSAAREFSDTQVRRDAARWLAWHDRGLTGAEQDAFLQWLAADPRHSEWFARHRQGWNRLDGIAAWHPQHGAEPNPDVLARPTRPVAWLRPIGLAAAALFVLAATITVWHLLPPPAESLRLAQSGGYERRLLDDGSVVELNGDAEIEVNYSSTERRVALRQGEAVFTVAKNRERPFVVRAGGVNVRAVGTAFSVRLESRRVEVLVTEGRVQVAPPTGPTAPATLPSEPPLVSAGQFAVVPLSAGSTVAVSPASASALARVQAWQPQLLDFAATPLADVVAELNRRNRIQLVLADPALGRIVIAASIRSDNLDGFVQLLATTAQLRAEPQGDYRIILRRAN